MNKFTQIILSIAGVLVIITCIVSILRKPASPSIELIQEWEKAKQRAVEEATQPLKDRIQELDRLPGGGYGERVMTEVPSDALF